MHLLFITVQIIQAASLPTCMQTWFPSSSQLWSIITNWREAINMRLKQILDKLNVWRDSAVITKQTSQWDYYFPWALLLHLIGCDILPPPHHSAVQWLKQPINHSFQQLQDYRWALELPLKSCKGWQDSSAPHCCRQNWLILMQRNSNPPLMILLKLIVKTIKFVSWDNNMRHASPRMRHHFKGTK